MVEELKGNESKQAKKKKKKTKPTPTKGRGESGLGGCVLGISGVYLA
jgi:hypothetical protein